MTTTTGAGAPAAAGAAVPARRAVSGASPGSGVFVTSGAAACGVPATSGACAASGSSGASGASGTGRVARPRADALRNRERIVAAAREMLVESGADAPLDEIARRAGVGNATVYRHFPDRTTLVHEVVVSVMARIAESAERAAAEEPEPFAAVRRFTHEAADERIGALCPMLSGVFEPDEPCVAAARDRLETAVLGLFERAQAAGRMRADVAVGDLMVALSQLTRPLPGIACPVNDQFVHRHLQLLLDGLEAPGRSELPGAPATLEGLRRPTTPESRENAEAPEGPEESEGPDQQSRP
ncbi:TetR/AcrR family transcriptional regulator [Streptomyces sp. enrichment culture]|uniref:TetR/AcrR family transcriptional regulator n=1 Tax=Streptomyces sp. enrichment culture TaxID=1795815 RepID=UPI003F54A1D5